MPRVKGGTVTRKRRKRILKLSKGYYGSKHTLYRTANEQVLKSLTYAYRDRKQTKRNFRKLWITRINAAARMEGLSYSQFMHGLKLANVDVNRKMLADLAVNDLNAFNQLVAISKDALANPPAVVEEAPVVEETPVVKEVKAEPKKEVAKEVKAEPKKEAAKEVKAEPKKEETAVAGPTDAKALAKLTVVELRELAKEREIAIPSGSLKADIVKLLSE